MMMFFEKALQKDFEIRGVKYKVDPDDPAEPCELCKSKKESKMLCRQHTSIHRVLNANDVAFDEDTRAYFYKNEIFRMVGDKLVIIYCPHPKLITGAITDKKVRMISPITISDPENLEVPDFDNVKSFLSSTLMDQRMKCWFNREFSIVTDPEDRNMSNWMLVSNR